MEISNEILEVIVNEQKISGLGLVTPAGKPHCTPVWVHHFKGKLYVFTRSKRAKARYAEATPECMIAFDFASLRGDIALIAKGTPAYEKIRDIPDARYGDNEQLESYKENWDMALEITPTKLYR